jgi:hypothetical protein
MENLQLIQENPKSNVYELILEGGEELSLKLLKQLNAEGYVYHSEQLDIDFEDEDEDGNTVTEYMNIYYFSKAEENIHESQMVL